MPLRPTVPFPPEPVDEIFLPDAPLVAVVAQVRFPVITSIARDEFIGPFQEQIRTDYPVLHQINEAAFVLGAQGLSTSDDSGSIWRFRDKEDKWGVALAPSFIAFDTSAYTDRADFMRRFHAVLRALAATIAPATFERFGLRYADRVDLAEGVSDLANLVRSEMRGPATADLGSNAELLHSLSDAAIKLQDAEFHARWGVMRPNTQLDPFHGAGSKHSSWLLDLDMYTSRVEDFDVDVLIRRADDFARRIYAFFRWAVEDELLKRCGGAL